MLAYNSSSSTLERVVGYIRADPREINLHKIVTSGGINDLRDAVSVLNKFDKPVSLEQKGDPVWNRTLLLDAYGSKEKMEYLIAQGADLNARNSFNDTLLHEVAHFGTLRGLYYVCSLLSTTECELHLDIHGFANKTPLLYACGSDRHALPKVKLLILQGADLSLSDCRGNTVLHESANFGTLELLQFVYSEAVDLVSINAIGESGNTPLLCACGSTTEALEKVKFLIARGADMSIVNQAGNSLLHEAARLGSFELLFYIYSKLNSPSQFRSFAIDTPGSERKTALLHACSSPKHSLEKVKFLIAKGADSTIKDANGNSAMSYAAKECHADVVQFLLEPTSHIEALDEFTYQSTKRCGCCLNTCP